MSTETLEELAKKFLSGTASEEEAKRLHTWYDNWQDDEEVIVTEIEESEEQIRDRIFVQIQEKIKEENKKMTPIIPIWGRKWLKYAAIIFLMAGSAILWYLNKPDEIKVLASQTERFKNDIKPGGNKAILILADGSKITLDSAGKGELAIQANALIEKPAEGELAYTEDNQKKATEVLFNMVSTPKGGQYQVLLSDGTKVWLNAASSLKFPTSFPGNEREVELQGEAYFEVSKNADKPFHVLVNDMRVEVLGTHFNIMAYDNESVIKTTLLEGSVKVRKGESTQILEPGQQAQLQQNETIKLVKDADLAETMAWKNGLFKFNDLTIDEIMHQVERWYDISFKYEGKVPDHFVSTLPRNMTMIQLFKILEETGKVHFIIDGKNVTVMP